MHKNSYLRDGWNVLDFIVVLSCIIEFMPIGTASVKGIRALRALRPLKSINAVPSMKKLVKILLISLPNLADVFSLLTYIILLFGILGLYLFCGNLYYRCRLTEAPISPHNWPVLEEYESLCNPNHAHSCPEHTYCGHPSQYNLTLEDENITSSKLLFYGVISFDNIGVSILTVF